MLYFKQIEEKHLGCYLAEIIPTEPDAVKTVEGKCS